jgi:HK97 family phage major capsid protein
MNIKQCKQALADNGAAQAKLKAEGRKLLAIADRTDEQQARVNAIATELDQLVAAAVPLSAELANLERFAEEEKASALPVIVPGADRAALKPWGPVLHRDATAAMKAEAHVAGLGEFAIAVRNAATGQGFDPRLSAAATGMNSTTGADGGFAIPVEYAAGIESTMFQTGDLLSRVDARSISGDRIVYTAIDETSRATGSRQGGVTGYWVDQGTAPTASQTKLARIEMTLRKVAALGYMTDELVADAAALGGELQAMFVEELQFQTEDAIFRGTGAGHPLGFMSAPCLVSQAAEGGQTADTINGTNLSKMWARMPARSKRNAVWLVNTECGPQLDALVFPTGSTEVAARFVNFGPDGVTTIKGRPVIECEYSAAIGDLGDIVLVDLSRYRLIRKGGVEQASSMHVRFAQGEQTFRATYRVDGQPVPRSAITPYKGAATLSPFVALAAR